MVHAQVLVVRMLTPGSLESSSASVKRETLPGLCILEDVASMNGRKLVEGCIIRLQLHTGGVDIWT